jgi:hypothetical protein
VRQRAEKSCHGGGSDADAFIEAKTVRLESAIVVFTVSAGSVIKAGMLLYLFPIISL